MSLLGTTLKYLAVTMLVPLVVSVLWLIYFAFTVFYVALLYALSVVPVPGTVSWTHSSCCCLRCSSAGPPARPAAA